MIEKIGDIAKRILENWNVCDKERVDDIESVWCRIIDDDLKGHTYVNAFKNGILYIKVDSSCYRTVLNMRKQEIIKRLKRKNFNVKKIVIKL